MTALKIRWQWELSEGIVTRPHPGGSDGLGPGIELGVGSPSLLEAAWGELTTEHTPEPELEPEPKPEPEPEPELARDSEEVSTSGVVPPTLAATIAPVPSVVQRPPQIEVQTAGSGSGTESETES